MSGKSKLYRNLKILTSLVCMVLFFWLVFHICQKYFDNATLVLSSTQDQLKELPLPSLLGCYKTPYKRISNITIWNKEEYSSLTDDPRNIVKHLKIEDCPFCHGVIPSHAVSELATVYQGRCLKIDVDAKVAQSV